MSNLSMEPKFSQPLFSFSDLSEQELQIILFKILDHLNLSAFRTNATKHGTVEIVVTKVVNFE